jgi:hypothetical protein
MIGMLMGHLQLTRPLLPEANAEFKEADTYLESHERPKHFDNQRNSLVNVVAFQQEDRAKKRGRERDARAPHVSPNPKHQLNMGLRSEH